MKFYYFFLNAVLKVVKRDKVVISEEKVTWLQEAQIESLVLQRKLSMIDV